MDIIDRVIEAEGGEKETNDSSDSGGRTKFGISQRSHPEAWADGNVTREEARGIYANIYILAEHFDLIRPVNPVLFHQLVDWGVTSGPDKVARILQQLVGVTVDGEIGPLTIKAIGEYPAGTLFGIPVPGGVLLNLRLRDARTLFYVALAKARPKDQKFVLGWVNRTQEFK